MIRKEINKRQKVKTKTRTVVLLFALIIIAIAMPACSSQEKGTPVQTEAIDKWIDTKMISEKDGKPHDIKLKLISIDRNKENVQKAIDEYNTAPTSGQLASLDSDDKSYALVKYQMKLPEDFPVNTFGLNDPAPTFTITDKYGNNSITIGNTKYEGLNQTWEIGSLDSGFTLPPGQTYDGQFVFVMVNEFSDYCIKQSCPAEKEGEEETAIYFKGV